MSHVQSGRVQAFRASRRDRRPERVDVLLRRVVRCERGLSSVEYVVALVLVGAVSVAAWNVFGNELACKLSGVVDGIERGLGVARANAPIGQCQTSPAGTAYASSMGGGKTGGSPSANGNPRSEAAERDQRAPRKPSGGATAAAWTKSVQAALCPQDKAFLADLAARGVTVKVYKSIDFYDPYYDGRKWTTKPFPAGGTTGGNAIEVIANGSPTEDAATLYHEAVHTKQPPSMSWAEKEYQAYHEEEQFRIDRGFPPHLRRTDASGKAVPDDAAIHQLVDGDYPGVVAAPSTGTAPEQIIGRMNNGDTKLQRADGTIYTRPPRKGDSFAAKEPVKKPKNGSNVDMAKLQCP